jgi:hypothetical protein
MKIKNLSKCQILGVIIVLGVSSLLLMLLGKPMWYKMQQDQIGTELTPADVVHTFQDAGIETRGLTDVVAYYPMGIPGECGMEFTSTIASDTYHIIVARYVTWEKALGRAKTVNELNQRMRGGHASAFHYGPILVQVYPSSEVVTNKLQSILQGLE